MDMHICILEAGKPGEALLHKHGSYGRMIEHWLGPALPEARFSAIDLWSGQPLPEDCSGFDAFVVSGSKAGVYEDYPWIAPLISFLREVRVQRRPLAGICFGHQVMAQAFGGVAEKADTGWILGRNRHTLTPAGQTLFGKTALWALSIHQDQVTGVPDGAVRLVGDDFSPNGGLLYLDFPGISVQFHPEFGPEYLSDLIQHSIGLRFAPDQAYAALAGLDGSNDGLDVAAAVARVFREGQDASQYAACGVARIGYDRRTPGIPIKRPWQGAYRKMSQTEEGNGATSCDTTLRQVSPRR